MILHPLTARWLGRQPYEPVWAAMRAFTDARDAATPDQIWLLDHDPVFTLGQAGKPEHVLAPGDIPVLKVDRGGQVTYHGPGQLIAYPMLDLRRLGIGVRELVTRLEQVGIDLLAEFDIAAERRAGAPGLYVDGRKIMAIGIRVRRGCTFHGIALNADMDLEPFLRINPCGYRGLEVTRIADFGPSPALVELAGRYLRCFAATFGFADCTPFASEVPQFSTCPPQDGGVRSQPV